MKAIELIRKLQADKKMSMDRFHRDPANKKAFGNKDDKPEEFKDKTMLYIRSTNTDNGSRPLPANTVYWNSPDIELFNSSGTLIPTNELALNQNHTITVLVHNDGDMSCNSCVVDLFICNPSIGFDRPHATQIGVTTLSILGHNTATASFNFTPNNNNLGHQCLFARAYSYINADMPNSADQFNTTIDRHIAQQNLSIVNQGATFEFMVFTPMQMKQQNFTLKVTQNKNAVNKKPINALANLVITNKDIKVNRFLFLNNIGTKKSLNIIQNKANIMPQKSYYVQLLLHILSLIFKKSIDTTRFEAMKSISTNTWTKEFKGGANKVTMEIPFMFLRKNNATQFEIEMINEKTGESIGGLTIIVKG